MNFGGMVLPSTFIALAYVTWPIVGKYSGAHGAWIGTLAVVGTLASVMAFSGRELANPPVMRAVALMLFAGAINGVGVYFYSMKAADPEIQTGVFVVMTAVMMVVWAPILDRALNGSVFSAQQLLGFGTAALTIYLLGK